MLKFAVYTKLCLAMPMYRKFVTAAGKKAKLTQVLNSQGAAKDVQMYRSAVYLVCFQISSHLLVRTRERDRWLLDQCHVVDLHEREQRRAKRVKQRIE